MTKVDKTLFSVYFYSGIPKANKNHGLFTYTIIVCSVFVMYIINILYLYCLFVAQWSVRSGLHVSLNYPCTPSPTLPRIIESTRYFVSLTTYVGKCRTFSCFLTIWYPSLASPWYTAQITRMTGTFARKLVINNTVQWIPFFLRWIT